MRLKSKIEILEQDFQQLRSENSEVFDWIIEKPISGLLYVNSDQGASAFYISSSLWSTLGFESPTPDDQSRLWSKVLTDSGKALIEKAFNDSTEAFYKTIQHFTLNDAADAGLDFTVEALEHTEQSGKKHFVLKFLDRQISFSQENIDYLQKYNEIYEETNELALVGGWEVDLTNQKVFWSSLTKKIHEVSMDYEPDMDTGINFYKEGWSREKIYKAFYDCVDNGGSFDAEFIMVTTTGKEKWVRSLGRAVMQNGKCVRVYGAFQDITAQKLQEESLRKTELRFTQIFENSAIGIILVNTKNELQLVNTVAKKIFGFEDRPETEILKYTFKDVLLPEYLNTAIEKRNQLLRGEIEHYSFEAACYNRLGKVIWCNLNCSLVNDGSVDDDLIITQVEDITQRKKLQKNALQNASRFKRVFENAPHGMVLLDLKGNLRNVNKSLCDILGYSKEELLEKSIEDFTYAEDRDEVLTYFSRIVAKEIPSFQLSKRYRHKDGEVRECNLTISGLLDENRDVRSFIAHVVDVTEEQKAQQALEESLLDHKALLNATSRVIIVETDLNHRIKRFNKGAENLLGYTEDEVIGKLYPEVFYVKEEVEAYAKQLEKEYGEKVAIEDVFTFKLGKGKIESNEWNYIKKNGDKLPVQLIVTPIKNDKGEPKGYLKISTDISALKAMETSLLQAKERAEQANQFKSEFLANMSHEIRTPLNGVIGFTDILMQSKLDQNQTKYVETIYSSAVSLLDLLNDILDFSKIESGKLNLSEERVNIADLCARSVEMIRHQAHQKNLEVLLNISTKIEEYILADGLRLRQILINLLSNAVKFTHKGEIELKVQAQDIPDDPNTKRFTFSLRDTGIGIAPQNVKEIFDAFNQGDASTTRKYGGTGLGLTISNRLLELMHSKLEVSSELGNGTTFSFSVDFAIEAKTERAASYSQELKRVLVVDDNQNNRVIIAELLASRKIKTIQAANGIDALEILQKDTDFDLALIDYAMPYLNGLDLIEHIRTDLKVTQEQLPIVLLHSSEEDQTINDRCKKLGIHNKLVKPVLRKVLFETMDSLGFSNDQFAQKVDFDAIEDLQDKLTIMVAEDNPVNKFLTRTILNKIAAQAKLIEVENGEQAVAAFKKNHIDIILMDIQMPVLSGYEATQQIRALEPKEERVPIIALTARALKGERERCLSYGMDDYISKPLILEDIKAVINAFLERKKITLK